MTYVVKVKDGSGIEHESEITGPASSADAVKYFMASHPDAELVSVTPDDSKKETVSVHVVMEPGVSKE